MQREEIAGPDYNPKENFVKGGTQVGSVFVGDQKLRIRYPRVRHADEGELGLPAYRTMRIMPCDLRKTCVPSLGTW
jgi:hypothetical protein